MGFNEILICRRGFGAVSQGVEAARKSGMATKVVGKVEQAPWTPDPVTGYYRPENAADEIDVAELRAMLLKQGKNKKNLN